ncbi:deoxyribonuclease [Vibrio galatheae]|uniref:Deoxyribonuclease n=1 Tax=Vibrio galatheae TaxID=579748 RepID=A0A0F4NHB1_9VIBR|nr:TatD family hydrolase [Vibrio galatheae]KJY82253.1 deoxyribonuclease [Vibrio galatheae]
MRLFDTHCHLDFDVFAADLDGHIDAAKQAGVERFVIPSIGPSNWRKVADLADQYSSIYYALGIHPYFIDPDSHTYQKQLRQLLTERPAQCVAVGECGLDAMVGIDRLRQEQIFVQQVELAQAFQLPLIIHIRKTHNRLLQLLKQYRFSYGGVIHGFSGSYQQAMQFVDMGFFIGVGGVITYPRASKTRQAIIQLPLESIVLETDSPDMPLNGHQGKENHPKMLAQIVSCLASLKGMSKQTVAERVWKNSNSAFGICE